MALTHPPSGTTIRLFVALASCLILHTTDVPAQLPAAPQRAVPRPAVKTFIDSMVTRHRFEEHALTADLAGIQPRADIIELVKPPAVPGRRSWKAYRARFVESIRIRAGVAFWNAHAAALARAEEETGVPAEIIVGILGIETMYGQQMGRFPVLEALTTLAFDYPETPNQDLRSQLFTRELEAYLLWCRDTKQPPRALSGSYTGAIGIPQFLPSSIRAHAVDFDGDGIIDLRNSPDDAIGSVARFLVHHGWQRGQPVLWHLAPTRDVLSQAGLLADGDPELKWQLGTLLGAGLRPRGLTPQQIRRLRKTEAATPALLIDLSSPDQATEYRIGFTNFYAITRYNRSFFYATTVADLGQAVKAARKARPRSRRP